MKLSSFPSILVFKVSPLHISETHKTAISNRKRSSGVPLVIQSRILQFELTVNLNIQQFFFSLSIHGFTNASWKRICIETLFQFRKLTWLPIVRPSNSVFVQFLHFWTEFLPSDFPFIVVIDKFYQIHPAWDLVVHKTCFQVRKITLRMQVYREAGEDKLVRVVWQLFPLSKVSSSRLRSCEWRKLVLGELYLLWAYNSSNLVTEDQISKKGKHERGGFSLGGQLFCLA